MSIIYLLLEYSYNFYLLFNYVVEVALQLFNRFVFHFYGDFLLTRSLMYILNAIRYLRLIKP